MSLTRRALLRSTAAVAGLAAIAPLDGFADLPAMPPIRPDVLQAVEYDLIMFGTGAQEFDAVTQQWRHVPLEQIRDLRAFDARPDTRVEAVRYAALKPGYGRSPADLVRTL